MAEKEAVDPQAFKKAVDEKTNARLKMWLEICAHCGLCADAPIAAFVLTPATFTSPMIGIPS
jgi:formate hydrogenlyase subunit 6/NADH:ubiquinone oxidoreductase subunit I